MTEAAGRKSAWFPRGGNSNAARIRLFILPFAGGGAAQFQALCQAAPDWIDVQPVQLPGRENRLFEPAVSDLPQLVEELRREVLPYLDMPYALLGYSMGARLSLGLVHALAAARQPLPFQLIVAANPAPALPPRIPDVTSLDSKAFWELIAGYDGTPDEVLRDDELKKLVEPTLRADFYISRQRVGRNETQPDVPILAIAGQNDPYAAPGDMQFWRDETGGPFRLEVIDGGHFFLHTHLDDFTSCVFDALKAVSPP